jgi:hypothetical protein
VTPQPRVFRSVAIPIDVKEASSIERADIVVTGVEQAGPSFELRVFVNNPGADADTEPTAESGYAGSIYVYGYGQPLPPGSGTTPHLPMTRYVVATDAIRAAAAEGATATVTVVPVAFAGPEPDIDLTDLDVSVLVRE